MNHPWIADRTAAFDSSGIRKVFDLAAKMTDPINLSIGQPDFDVPEPVKEAAITAIREGKNGYALTQGMPVLRNKLQAMIDAEFGHSDRTNFVCSGTSGGLVLSMLALVNPGDEVIIFDPYFVMYESLVKLVGGVPVVINTYPDFRIDLEKVRATITPKTKLILLNSPANPTGVVATAAEVEGLAKLTAEKNIALISDEIYRTFTYGEFVSPAKFNDQTIVIDGFSKSYGMTGWRVGYVHGPSAIIDTMIKLQQYTFVCAPQPAQWASAAALDVDMSEHVATYAHKRDMMLDGISDLYEVSRPEGAFYIFPKAPWGTGSEFVAKAIENSLLIIPGKIFSKQDTHFRISYAAQDETLKRGIDMLRKIAKG
ncbi:aminotransferase class I/II-fold pyridoxal phosphate-dependent enzyme [Blastopirellula sp. JC732]|uniref:Aminotransferase n=1 Tax=Blastopirellula sediminis TaxID=2894196 RepID=A0A9X1MQW4_9BACT|nr:aminotransferase class I/II-fold pyridoxal phosphate-dependent enzyme [Blastopirellula sediminis]MCC9605951.1 aminotransferase class I/II-fold pyridoxal phosphate-dependent enzyme [Blastopirellula sediminis]MCC9630750.1 aminotransferase class I/II-fold pyridoxal phosphate-dependent enzyme [Blastopirellula sediminis]